LKTLVAERNGEIGGDERGGHPPGLRL